MSIVRALIKFKGNVRAAADYILAGAPIELPKYVRSGEFFYPLVETEIGYGAAVSGGEPIQDKDTYIQAEDLETFNHYDQQLEYMGESGDDEEDTKRNMENLIYTFVQPKNPGPNDTFLPTVYDTTGEEVKFREFEPYDISSGENDLFLFTYKVERFDGEKIITVEKRVFMSLDTAQLYLETAAIKLRNWLLHGLLARLILQTENTFSVDQFGQLLAFEDNKYSLDFADNPKLWNGRFFVNGQQFSVQNKQLYTGKGDDIYTLLRQQATEDNPHPEYLLFRMAENSVSDLFQDIGKDPEERRMQQARRIQLTVAFGRILYEVGLLMHPIFTPPLTALLGPKAYDVLYKS